jgi:arylsulfatase A-like enzyme
VDVTPTILALLGVAEADGLDGRMLAEALAGGPDPEQVAIETRVHTVTAGGYRAALQLSDVDGRRYVDKSWRIR